MDWIGISAWSSIGPLYSTTMFIASVANSIIYLTLHAEFRKAALRVFRRRPLNGDEAPKMRAAALATMTNVLSTWQKASQRAQAVERRRLIARV